jgi:hypothetical protein
LERERGPFWFLERSLDAIEREAPVAYGLIVRALGRRAIVIAIGDDVATLSMASGSHAIARDGGARGAVELSLTEAIVRRLLEGRLTIVDAALAGDLVLRGAADDLAALHDALLAFIHGAVRSSSTPRLLESYLDRDAPSNGRPRSRGANHGERHGPPHR